MASKNSRGGFTLIELMIVVVIMGILAAVFIPNFISMQDRAKEVVVKSNAHNVQLAVEDYAVRNNGLYPEVFKGEGYIEFAHPLYFIDLLPNGQKVENPFTGELTEPRPARSNPPLDPEPGAIYYYCSRGLKNGYAILGYGKYPENGPITKLTN